VENMKKDNNQAPDFIKVLDEKELYEVAGGCGCGTAGTHSICASDGTIDGDTKQQ
jgi:hypothetical protein